MLIALTGIATVNLVNPEVAYAAVPDDTVAPEVYKILAYNKRLGGNDDEFRIDLILKVPRGWVDPTTGALKNGGSSNNKQLRMGFDNNPLNPPANTYLGRTNLLYLNTMNGAAGARAWATNGGQYFTIHKVLQSGDYDFLAVSIEGDMVMNADASAANVVDGKPLTLNLYFNYHLSTDINIYGTATAGALIYPLDIRFFVKGSGPAPTNVNGPRIQMHYDEGLYMWAWGQTNWGQVLDFNGALGGTAINISGTTMPAGFLPPNSVAVDLSNMATNNPNPESGPAMSVSDSFWYAWVHEDNSLVTSINTGPIRVTGNRPRATAGVGTRNDAVRNCIPGTGDTAASWRCAGVANYPSLAWTQVQGNQGLTNKVSVDGRIDFRDAGGTGYYKLLVWPESRNPTTVTVNNGAPQRSYTAGDLFQNGQLTETALAMAWPVGSVFYKYDIDRPEPPINTTPAPGATTNEKSSITISGTGIPGSTVSLKYRLGAHWIEDFNDPALITIIAGDHAAQAGDVVVGEDGTWTYTYTPSTPLTEGLYSIVSVQTEQDSGYLLTSYVSNVVQIEIDTLSPTAPTMTCPALVVSDGELTIDGAGVATDAEKIFIYAKKGTDDPVKLGEATKDGATWTYEFSTALTPGQYAFYVTAVDAAGNESTASTPSCPVQILADVEITGTKIVAPVAYGSSALSEADPANWEITVFDGTDTSVISGVEEVKIKPGTTYTVAERVRTTPDPEVEVPYYLQKGAISCVDGEGAALPEDVFDAESGELTLDDTGALDPVEGPIACSVTNQAAQVSFVTKRVGGQTVAPLPDWTLDLAHADAQYDVQLDDSSSTVIALPSSYQLSAQAPAGISIVALERLDLADDDCAALADTAASAPESCWVQVSSGATGDDEMLPQGQHAVYRVLAAVPADVPPLPLTGGLGTWQFLAAGAGVLLLACGAYWHRQRRFAAAAGGGAPHNFLAPLSPGREVPRSHPTYPPQIVIND